MRRLKKSLSALTAMIMVVSSLLVGSFTAHAASEVWTESSYVNVFLDSTKPKGASSSINLVAAKNEFEAAQILLRNTSAFTINSVAFTNLTSGANTIASSNLKYQFVEYAYLNANSNFYYLARSTPGFYPDDFSNATSKVVDANATQPVWVRVKVPKTAAAGIYTGTATVNTTMGNFVVNMTVDVQNVAIPDAQDGTFNNAMWMQFFGPISWDTVNGDDIKMTFGWDRSTPQWWALMADFAQFMKDYRNNNLPVNMHYLMLDGGTTLSASGVYTFNWSKFDEVIQYFITNGAVKRLEGLFMAQSMVGRAKTQAQIIDRDASGASIRNFVDWDSPKATAWIDAFIPALKAHLDEKGWTDMWWMHVEDEIGSQGQVDAYKYIVDRMKLYWPTIRIGDAMLSQWATEQIDDYANLFMPYTTVFEANIPYYQNVQAAGNELWFYNSGGYGNFMNRAIDQPVWTQRSNIWYAFKQGVSGYLHWGYNHWDYSVAQQGTKGDGFIVYPDVPNNKLRASIRLESLRDGIEEYELMNIVKQTSPDVAKGIAASLVTTGERYTRDTDYMNRMHAILVRAAAGSGFSTDLAAGKAVTFSTQTTGNEAAKAVDSNASTQWQSSAAGSQWIAVDLGAQYKVDAVKLKWGASYATNYKIQTSYNGTNWADVANITDGNGGDDFSGVNAKARYVRISATASSGSAYALASLEVGGNALPRPNLAGGKTYTISVPLNDNYPDTNYESTNGVVGGRYDDGKTWANRMDGGTHYQSVIIDLGSMQMVDQIKSRAYENYESNYRPEYVDFFTSTDGINFTHKGVLFKPNAESGSVYDFTFPAVSARYIKTSSFKTYAPNANYLFIDEQEVYGPTGS